MPRLNAGVGAINVEAHGETAASGGSEQLVSEVAAAPHSSDSLVCLLDGGGMLSSKLLSFLSLWDVARCEIVCKTLRRQAPPYWEVKAKDVPPACRSESATTPKQTVVRNLLTEEVYKKTRRLQCNCGDPKYEGKNSRDYELLIIITQDDEHRTNIFKGFVPFTGDLDDVLTISLKDVPMNSSSSHMRQVVSSINQKGRIRDVYSLQLCMEDLTITAIVVSKSDPWNAGLLFFVSDFSDSEDVRDRMRVSCWSEDKESFGDTYAFVLTTRTAGEWRSVQDGGGRNEKPEFWWELQSLYKR